MKKTTWHKHHKWLGILLSFFLLMFCLSGLVLNHPALFSDINISRSYLPESYQYSQWNRGLLRGTVKWHDKVLLYGNAGIWQTDSTARSFNDFNQGLPTSETCVEWPSCLLEESLLQDNTDYMNS